MAGAESSSPASLCFLDLPFCFFFMGLYFFRILVRSLVNWDEEDFLSPFFVLPPALAVVSGAIP